MQLSSPFRRKSEAPATDVAEVEEQPVSTTRPRGYTPSKRERGLVTPKRKEGVRRVEAPPKDRREAAKRARERRKELREKQRAQRAEIRAGMLAGKEEFLPARDKGPERSLVRDIVDARRNVASYFLPGAFIVLIGSSGALPQAVQFGVTLFWAALTVGIVVDSFLLTRRIKKLLLKRFPKATKPPRAYYVYGVLRSLQFRRMRLPGPKVNVGDPVGA